MRYFSIAMTVVGLFAPVVTAAGPFRLATKEDDARYRSVVPRVSDEKLQALMADPATLFYTEKEMPRAHQDWGGGLPGVHTAYHSVAANPDGLPSNANTEFPWNKTFGLWDTPNAAAVKFVRLPGRPVVWYKNAEGGFSWVFPAGTVFGEVLYQRCPDGLDRPFEVRTRTRQLHNWTFEVYRPYPSAGELATMVTLRFPDYESRPRLFRLHRHLTTPLTVAEVYRTDPDAARHTRIAFTSEPRKKDLLPPVDPSDAVKLLDVPFRPVSGVAWREGPGNADAPTSDSFHVVPANYGGGFVRTDREACMLCHQDTNKRARSFAPAREWYGNVRGSDGILSFMPFDPTSVSHTGSPQPVLFDRRMVAAGMIERYSPQHHTGDHYGTIRGID